jgi:hypothetical protein
VVIDGDRAARALTDAWQHLAAEMPGAWTLREHGAVAAVTTVPGRDKAPVLVAVRGAGWSGSALQMPSTPADVPARRRWPKAVAVGSQQGE